MIFIRAKIADSIMLLTMLFIGMLFMGGCQITPTKDNSAVEIARGVHLKLMPVERSDSKLTILQDVVGKYANKEYRMISQIEFNESFFVVVGMSPVGNRLFSIVVKPGTLQSETSLLMPSEFNPGYVVADIQLAHWPIDVIKQHLIGDDVSVIELNAPNGLNGTKHLRQFWHQGKKIIEVEYQTTERWNNAVIFRNLERAYSVTSKTLEVSKNE